MFSFDKKIPISQAQEKESRACKTQEIASENIQSTLAHTDQSSTVFITTNVSTPHTSSSESNHTETSCSVLSKKAPHEVHCRVRLCLAVWSRTPLCVTSYWPWHRLEGMEVIFLFPRRCSRAMIAHDIVTCNSIVHILHLSNSGE